MTTDPYSWPDLPKGVDGVQVRYRRITDGVRVGGAEPKVIVAETEHCVVWEVFNSRGRSLGIDHLMRANFEALFERREVRCSATTPHHEEDAVTNKIAGLYLNLAKALKALDAAGEDVRGPDFGGVLVEGVSGRVIYTGGDYVVEQS